MRALSLPQKAQDPHRGRIRQNSGGEQLLFLRIQLLSLCSCLSQGFSCLGELEGIALISIAQKAQRMCPADKIIRRPVADKGAHLPSHRGLDDPVAAGGAAGREGGAYQIGV